MATAFLREARARWVDAPYPMVVEHRPGDAEHICPAPSLWMGGRAVAEALRAAGLGPGHRVRHTGDTAIGFVQTLVGALRVGATFVAADAPGWTPHAAVGDDLSLALDRAPSTGDASRRLCALDADGAPAALDGDTLDALADDAAALYSPHTRVEARGAWHELLWLAVDVLGPLRARAELHRARDGAWQSASCGHPEVFTASVPPRREGDTRSAVTAVLARDGHTDARGAAVVAVHLDGAGRLRAHGHPAFDALTGARRTEATTTPTTDGTR